MIVVDSSALVAILLAEPEKPAFEELIAGGERCVISAVNAHETATVTLSAAQRLPSIATAKASIPRHGSTFPTARPTRWPRP
jgi:uncharacterized protein with PIN domain